MDISMIYVRELLRLEPFREFELVAGERGLDRAVTDFGVLDYELVSEDYTDFRKGEFVLSSLLFRQDYPETTVNAVRQLIARGVSGLAIRVFDCTTIPDEVLTLVEDAGISLFIFRKVFVNDIIISANDYSRAKERYELASRKVDELIGRSFSASAIVRDLDPMLLPCCVASFAYPKPGTNLDAVTFRLMQRYTYSEKGIYRTFIPYSGGILLLDTAQSPSASDLGEKAVLSNFNDIGVSEANYYIGMSTGVESYDDYPTAVLEALRASDMCRAGKKRLFHYSDGGIYRLLYAVLEDSASKRIYEGALRVLSSYDSANSSELVDTLAEYVRRRGDVKATAEAMYQHPNTIRYRLKKASSLLGLGEDSYEQLFILMSLYLMKKEAEEAK